MILFLMGVFEYPIWAVNICGVKKIYFLRFSRVITALCTCALDVTQ